MKKCLLIVGILLLQSCVSFTPIPEGYEGPLATVNDTSKEISGTKVYFFELSKIDSRNVSTSSYETRVRNDGRGFAMTPVLSKRQVPAKEVVLTLQGVTHVAAPILALGGGNYFVKGDVLVNLEESKIYYAKGSLSKEYSAVWLEDSEGNIVSDKIEKQK